MTAPATITEDEAKAMAMASETIQPQIEGKQVKRVIYVTGKLVNIVVVDG